MNILIMSSNGLIGPAAVEDFDRQGHRVVGADNNICRHVLGHASTRGALTRTA